MLRSISPLRYAPTAAGFDRQIAKQIHHLLRQRHGLRRDVLKQFGFDVRQRLSGESEPPWRGHVRPAFAVAPHWLQCGARHTAPRFDSSPYPPAPDCLRRARFQRDSITPHLVTPVYSGQCQIIRVEKKLRCPPALWRRNISTSKWKSHGDCAPDRTMHELCEINHEMHEMR